MANMQISGNKFPGIRHISDGCGLLLDEIVSDLDTDVGLHVYVTHDAIICPLVGYLTEMLFDANNWIGYLNGAVFFKNDDEYYLLWSGNIYDVTHKVRDLIGDE